MTALKKRLIDYSDEEIVMRFQPSACACCGVQLHESTTGMRKVDGKSVCSSCYFVEIGKLIDEFPIGTPRVHR